ncbi:uncharacterized protein [Argopecten irradians]|uniref:uncharacterized protein n=1 Tax=Argopecten irradians TaxID=31199 RepID=UPI00371D74D4
MAPVRTTKAVSYFTATVTAAPDSPYWGAMNSRSRTGTGKEALGGGEEETRAKPIGGIHVQSTGTPVGQKDNKDQNKGRTISKQQTTGKQITFENLTCFYTNADQLKNKLSELAIRVNEIKPEIIGITEVKPKTRSLNMKPQEFSIEGNTDYCMFDKNIDNNMGRGMILYVNKLLQPKEVRLETNFQENIFIEVPLNVHEKLLIGLIYRSDSGSEENNNSLRNLINEATSKNYSKMIIMGDFNYPDINWETWNSKGDSTESHEYKLIHCLQDNFLSQVIEHPTRWRGNDTPHILDLVITNNEHIISSVDYQSPLGKSDHNVLIVKIDCQKSTKTTSRTRKCYNKANYDKLNEEINAVNWRQELKEDHTIEENWELFRNKIHGLIDKYVPTKSIKLNKNNKHNFPVDQDTLKLIKLKHSLSKQVVTSSDPEIRRQYCKIRHKVKAITRNLRKNYEQSLASKAKTDPKLIWKYINSKSKTKVEIGDLYVNPKDTNSRKATTAKEKADILAKFFQSVFVKEDEGESPTLADKKYHQRNVGTENNKRAYN